MKRKLRLVILLASLAGGGIISFQLFWIFNAYEVNNDNFNKTASLLLQQSIDSYQLASIGYGNCNCGPETIVEAKSDTTYKKVISSSAKKLQEKLKQEIAKGNIPLKSSFVTRDTIHTSSKVKKNATTPIQSVKSSSRTFSIKDAAVTQMIMRLAAKSKNEPILLDSLAKVYRKNLSKSNIEIDFKLSQLKTLPKTNVPPIIGRAGFSDSSNLIQAVFPNSFGWLFWRTLSPIIISFVLICLTIGGFWYLLYIIMHQRELDSMKNDFINNMTHELQTPIAILRSTHEALSQFGEAKDPEKTSRYLKMNLAVIDKLSTDVARILDISEYEKQEIVPALATINLKELVDGVIARFELSAQNRINFSYKAENEEVTTEAYAIDTIVSNLLDNALKYDKENGGQVWIEVDSFADYWQLQVQDKGIGIEPKYLPFIFDKFYRVPTGDLHNVKGYGLGLNYVKKLADMLKGEINVSSQPGLGTTFTLKFKYHEKN